MNVSNDDGNSIFDHWLARLAKKIKRNDPGLQSLALLGCDALNESASRRLGELLGSNISLKALYINCSNINEAELCRGIQNNRCIERLTFVGIALGDRETLARFSPFLTSNPSLRDLSLTNCGLQPDSIEGLSTAIASRTDHTLETIDLSGNRLGDMDLNDLVQALSRNRGLNSLSLNETGIGPRACASLARLLKGSESNLRRLNLCRNPLDNESVAILTESLARNESLVFLGLGGIARADAGTRLLRNGAITATGWTSLLNLVCNVSSISGVVGSNNTLAQIGMLHKHGMNTIKGALGTDDAALLRASMTLNHVENKADVTRQKIIWSHARGDLNIGVSSVPQGAMPLVLAWLGDSADDAIAELIQYHDFPIPLARIRLDSIYRILLSRPGLCN